MFVIAGVGVLAAPLQRNLDDGLVYFRIRAVPADLPADTAIDRHPAIVDVRYATADAAGAAVFGSWLKFHASRQQPLFVLANPATAAPLLSALHSASEPGVLTIGNAGHHFTPAIAVESSAADEKRAYQALDDGATVASLVADHPEKQRNDEASLMKPTPDSPGSDAAPTEPPVTSSNPTSPPTDAALQRAVQLFRGLKAMKAL
jgi:hypothetical protein